MSVHSLGYIRLASPNLDAWRSFGADVLGLMAVDRADGGVGFRLDAHPPRLVIVPAEEAAVQAVGFQVQDGAEVGRLGNALAEFGTPTIPGTEEEAADRQVTGFVKVTDPGGSPIELYHAPIRDHLPLVTPLVSRFVTGDMGMGHVVLSTGDFPATHRFYTEVLGFHERNSMLSKGRPMWFLSPNPRHHTLGIIEIAGDPKLFHFMLEVADIDDVGMALDRVDARGASLMLTLGRHTNDEMISFYVWAPDGYAVELGCAGPRIDAAEPTYAITKASHWGHRFVWPPPG